MTPPTPSNLVLVRHPLIEHKLSFVRDRRTTHKRMRELVSEISTLLAVRATRALQGDSETFDTPLESMTARRVREDRIVLVPILRAGLGMVEGVQRLIPEARVGHLGFYRSEETLEPVAYYASTPPHPERSTFLLLDPMVATGGTACASIAELKARGAADIALLCLITCPEGVARLAGEHPDVTVYAAAEDRQLNERGYIVPGLGDAGDRIFGTL